MVESSSLWLELGLLSEEEEHHFPVSLRGHRCLVAVAQSPLPSHHHPTFLSGLQVISSFPILWPQSTGANYRQESKKAVSFSKRKEESEGKKRRKIKRAGPPLCIKPFNGPNPRVKRSPPLDARCLASEKWSNPDSYGSWAGQHPEAMILVP